MDKIKNVFNPGSKKDDEVMYGSEKSDDPIRSGGQISHLGSSNTTGNAGDDMNPTLSTRNDPDSSTKPSKAEEILGSQDPMGGASTTRSAYPTSDTATTASVKSGVPGEAQTGKMIGSSTDGTATATGGPHSSNLGHKADPRIDSDGNGRAGLGATSSKVGAGGYGTDQGNTVLPDRSVRSAGYGDTTDQSGTSNLGRDAALGAGALKVGGTAGHHHHSGRDVAGSNTGRSFPLTGGTGNSSAAGPHSSNLANKADPRVDSDGSRGVSGTSGIGSATGKIESNATSAHGYGPEFWEKESRHTHDFHGDPCHGQEKPVEGVVHHTHGPHSLDIANALDPHVSTTPTSKAAPETSTVSGGIGSGSMTTGSGPSTINTGTGAGLTSGTDGSTIGRGLDPSDTGVNVQRDPGLSAAGVDAGAATTSGQSGKPRTGDETLAGPVHKSALLNKVDHRVKSVSTSEPTTFSGANDPVVSSATHKDHHYGRDAGLASGAMAGATSYEIGKDREGYSSGQYTSDTSHGLVSRVNAPSSGAPFSSTSGMTGSTDTSGGVPKRDAGLVGGGGATAYEAEKHLGHHDQSKPGSGPSRTTETTGGLSSTGTTSTTNEPTKDNHRGGLAAAGVGAGAGGVAAYEAEKPGHSHQNDPSHPSGLSASQKPYSYEGGRGTAQNELGASRKPYNQYDDTIPPNRGEHTGLGAVGAGAGVATAAGMSEKEIKKLEKEHAKDEKAHEKELEKEQKHHQKEVEKEQKALAKEEKKHHGHEVKAIEKQHTKDEKAHEKALAKEEKKHGHDDDKTDKKHHGGILGLFKRDKPDDELKQEELERKDTEIDHTNIPSMAEIGMSEKEKHALAKDDDHERNRLHKDPPAGYYEKVAQSDPSYAPAPEKGYASQVTGGTGTTALAQGKEMPTGSHLTNTGNKMDPYVASRGESVHGEGVTGTSTTSTTQIPATKHDVRDSTTDPSPHGL